jgi:ERCC4-related helicase
MFSFWNKKKDVIINATRDDRIKILYEMDINLENNEILKVRLNLIQSNNYELNIPEKDRDAIKYDLLTLDVDKYNIRSAIHCHDHHIITGMNEYLEKCESNQFPLLPSHLTPCFITDESNDVSVQINVNDGFIATNILIETTETGGSIKEKMDKYYKFLASIKLDAHKNLIY